MSVPLTALTMLALALSLPGLAAPARAEFSVFNDRATWEASTVLRVDRDFDDLPGHDQTLLPSPYVVKGVSFSATNNYLYSWGPGCCTSGDLFGTGGSWLIGPWDNGSLEVKFAPRTTAVGFDVGAYNGFPPLLHATIRMQSGRTFTAPLMPKASQGHVFLGVADGNDSVVSVTFKSTNGDNVVLDNVSTGITLRP